MASSISKPTYPPTIDIESDRSGDDAEQKKPAEPHKNPAANQSADNYVGKSREKGDPDRSDNSDQSPQESAGHTTKPFYQRPLLMTIVIVATLLLIVGGLIYWWHERQYEWTDDAFIDGHSVRLAPKIAGYVTRLNVTDNQFVNQGECLLEIDPRDSEIALAAAQEAEASAIGQVAQAVARVEAGSAQQREAEADVKAAAATAQNAQQDKERNTKLAPRAVSQESLDASVARARTTSAQLDAAIARVAASIEQVKLAKSQVTTAQAQAEQARVQVQQAKLNLSYTKIIAPMSGHVTRRTVEQGDYVQTGTPLMAIVSPRIWVTANFKETQLTEMRPGQPVEIRIDAYPNHRLRGHVDSIQRGSGARFSVLPAENATGNYVKVVQRIPVKLIIDDPIPDQLALGLGMSVIPTVTVRGTAQEDRRARRSIDDHSDTPEGSDESRQLTRTSQ